MASEKYPEVATIVVQSGRPDDGTDPGGYNNVEFFAPLKPEKTWPVVQRPSGVRKQRIRQEIIQDLSEELYGKFPGIEWSFSQYIRDNVMEAISGVKGDNSVKIYGPDLVKLEELAEQAKKVITNIPGVADVGIYHVMGQSNLEFGVDKNKCKIWGAQVADVNNVINTAVKGNPLAQMVEGEKLFDITLRWPHFRRENPDSILDIPVDINNNTLTAGSTPSVAQTSINGPSQGVSTRGTAWTPPAIGSAYQAAATNFLPRVPLRYLVSPVGPDGRADPDSKDYIRPGASIIARENGNRFVAVKFSVRDRDLASTVEDVHQKTEEVIKAPYWRVMGGEFEQMSDAETRMLYIIPASLVMIFMLLYLAFRSLIDAVVVLSNVLFSVVGGIWALYLMDVNFSVSAAVGFVSLFGVAIMDGLLLISYFNDARHRGLGVHDSIMQGAAMRVRPVMITALTAILGLLPAAMSHEIGAQTQRPLAIVVVGGMATTLFLTRYIMPILYSFYGHREPPAEGASMAH